MAEVLSIFPTKVVDDPPCLRAVRSEYGLSLLQAAVALGISASAVEEMERHGDDVFAPEMVRRKYELFVGTTNFGVGKNLLFDTYPLRMARELLDLSIDEMASRFGYKPSSWKRIEMNARPLHPDILARIEAEVRHKLSSVCLLSV